MLAGLFRLRGPREPLLFCLLLILLEKTVSGKRVLSGNNANDGIPLSLPYVETTADFMTYVKGTFLRFITSDFSRLLEIYGFTSSSPDPFGSLYDTLGDHGLTALADAFSRNDRKESWKYQYLVTPVYHGADLTAYFSIDTVIPIEGIRYAFQKMLGSFIIKDSLDAKGGISNAIIPENSNRQILWPMWNSSLLIMIDLNITGGSLLYRNLREDPGVVNYLRLANATFWEGGQGERCRFWREVGPRVP
ncbi:CAZyme family CE10 [Penicillium lividum]|nr:CAZyme family CE10 [Penicillium lividum]